MTKGNEARVWGTGGRKWGGDFRRMRMIESMIEMMYGVEIWDGVSRKR
jgi:hypothetical protein